jgi:hypothetical protein
MGLLDQVKASAGDIASKAMEGAADLAAKAKDEAKELQLKRDLAKAHEELGQKAYALVDSGAIAHDELDRHVARVREVSAQIAAHAQRQGASTAGGEASPNDAEKGSPPS